MSRNANTLHLFTGFKAALDHSISFAQQAAPGSLCFCVGAGGSGKSSLAKALGPMLFGARANWPRSSTPYLLVTADNPDRGFFSTKWFTYDCLRALNDPFRAPAPDVQGWGLEESAEAAVMREVQKHVRSIQSEACMRKAFVSLAKARQVKLIIIDEANLLTLTHRRRAPTDYLEGIRRLGDQIGCPVILLGTTKLLDLMGYSAQLNRRTFFVHLQRMSCAMEDQREDFCGFLRSLESDFGLDPDFLVQGAGDLYEWTYGIPGEIVGLLNRAKMLSGATDVHCLSWQQVCEGRHTPKIIQQMKEEADLIEIALRGEEVGPRANAGGEHERTGSG